MGLGFFFSGWRLRMHSPLGNNAKFYLMPTQKKKKVTHNVVEKAQQENAF